MAFEINISQLADKVLTHSDITQALSKPGSPIDAAYLRHQLIARGDALRTDVSSTTSEFDALEKELQGKRAQLQAFIEDIPWFEVILVLAGSVLVLSALVYGVSAFFSLSFSAFINKWIVASLHGGSQQDVSIAILSALLGLTGLTIYWENVLKPRRVAALSENLDIAGLEKRLEDARGRTEAAIDSAVLQNARFIVNAANEEFFQIRLVTATSAPGQIPTNLNVTVVGGLSEVAMGENVVPTESRRAIIQLIETLPGASIGISGPRGVGKSTLLTSLCSTNLRLDKAEAIAIYTASPVEYDPREFLLHIFSSLCRQLLKTRGLDEESVRTLTRELTVIGEQTPRVGFRPRFLFSLVTLVGLLATLFGILVAFLMWQIHVPLAAAASSAGGHTPPPSFWEQIDLKPGPLILWGVVTLLAGFSGSTILVARSATPGSLGGILRSIRSASTAASGAARTQQDGLVQYALRKLRDIQFQRNFTSGWSGALKAPVGVELEASGSVSYSQAAQSLPELVSEFRSFVSRIVAEESYGRVIVGIDELDKLNSAANAERFLNEIKSIFNIPKCYYLVSVSENALSNFERRGLPVRDAFDSAFDDIRHIDYLSLEGSRNLLMRRIFNLPGPYLCLCHALSGGLPRDLIRIARAMMVRAGGAAAPASLGNMASALAIGEAMEKFRATSIAARDVRVEPELSNLLVEIASLEEINRTSSLLQANLPPTAPSMPTHTNPEEQAKAKRLDQIRMELMAYLSFLLQVQTVFTKMTTEDMWRKALSLGIVDRLAEVRQGLELGVGIAEVRLAKLAGVVSSSAYS